MKTKLVIIGLLLLIMGCSKSILIPSTYVEKHDKNVVLFVSEEYKFKDENKFEYKYWSDDLNSSRYGVGNFQINKRSLLLEFTDETLTNPKSTLISKDTSIADSSQNFYQVHVKTYSGINLAGVNFFLTNLNNKIIKGITTNMNGMAKLVLSKKSMPSLLKINALGYEDMIFEINDNESLNFEVTLAEKVYGTRITNKRMEKRIKFKVNSIIIDGKEYQRVTVADNK